jgi:DNA-binding PadR family transcriptional regulator
MLGILECEVYNGVKSVNRVKSISEGTLEWSDGMLYPVLHRLEREGLVISQWKISDGGRYRKYYGLTDRGREELEAEKRQWLSVHSALAKLWKPTAA